MFINIEKLRHHPNNPRKDLGDLTELAESIKTQGLICPLLVVPSDYDSYAKTGTANEFFVIAGNRRLEACKLAGIENVCCEVASIDEETAIGIMLTENMLRQNLTSIEESDGFQLMLDMGKDEDTIAKETGLTKETIRMRTKLRKLDGKKLQKACDNGASIFELAAVAEVEDEKAREKLLAAAGTKNFNNAYESYKREQENKAYMLAVEEFMRDHEIEEYNASEYANGFITLKAKDEEGNVIAERGLQVFVKSFSFWNKPDLSEIVLEEGVHYSFIKSSYDITLYQDVTEEEYNKKKTALDERDEKNRLHADLCAKLGEINDRHKKLREDFILNFNDFKKKQKEIKQIANAALDKAFNSYNYGSYSARYDSLIDKLSDKEKLPVDKALLLKAFAIFENGDGYLRAGYENPCPLKINNESLDTLYDWLTALGYEMSTEEEEIKNGTHEMFPKDEEDTDGEEESA